MVPCLLMLLPIRAAIVTGLEKYLEEYRRARNVQSEVMAVNRFVGTFYAHCGNRRLDANMISMFLIIFPAKLRLRSMPPYP